MTEDTRIKMIQWMEDYKERDESQVSASPYELNDEAFEIFELILKETTD